MRPGKSALILRAVLMIGVLAYVTFAAGCAGGGFSGGGGPTPPPGTVTGPTLANFGDAAPDRVLALTFKVTAIQMVQTGGGTVNALQGTPTVEFSHLAAGFAPVNLTTTNTVAASYTGVNVSLSNAVVTFVDDTGAIQQDNAPTIVGGGTYSLTFASPVTLSGSAPSVLDLDLAPSSIAIDTLTNKATITPTFTATLAAPAALTSQTDATGEVVNVVGTITAAPTPGSNQFSIQFSQASQPITIHVDAATMYFGQVAGFGDLNANNVVEIQANTQLADGSLLAGSIIGLDAGAGHTTGADIQGVVTGVTYNVVPLTPVVSAASVRVQNPNGNGTLPSAGSNLGLSDFSLPPVLTIDQQDVDLSNLGASEGVFDISHLEPPQEVSVLYSNSGTLSKPSGMRLRLQTLAGTVLASSNGIVAGQQIIDFTPPADSIFNLLTCTTAGATPAVDPGCQTHIRVIRQPSSDTSQAIPTAGQPIRVRGLLFWDSVNQRYVMVADRFVP